MFHCEEQIMKISVRNNYSWSLCWAGI